MHTENSVIKAYWHSEHSHCKLQTVAAAQEKNYPQKQHKIYIENQTSI